VLPHSFSTLPRPLPQDWCCHPLERKQFRPWQLSGFFNVMTQCFNPENRTNDAIKENPFVF